MNTLLESLFDKYHLSEKQRYEIHQMYWFLTPEKKVDLMNNFEVLAMKLQAITDEINLERWILVESAIANITNVIRRVEKEEKDKKIKKQIEQLKQTLS